MNRCRLALALVCGVTLAAKLLLLLQINALPLIGDEVSYWSMSEGFFSHYFDRRHFFAPLQAAFLEVVRSSPVSDPQLAARIVQLVVHTATGGIVFLLGRELESEKLGLLAASIFLATPEAGSMAVLLYSETWSLFFFFGAIALYLPLLRRPSVTGFVIAGLALGVASLLRWVNLYSVVLVLVHCLWCLRSHRLARRLVWCAALLASTAIGPSIHALKNWHVLGEPLLDPTSTFNLWLSYNTFPPPVWDFAGTPRTQFDEQEGTRLRVLVSSPSLAKRLELRNAARHAAQNPILTLRRRIENVGTFFRPAVFAQMYIANIPPSFVQKVASSRSARIGIALGVMVVTTLGLTGLLFAPPGPLRSLFAWLSCYHLGLSALFLSSSRLRLAIFPILVLFASWAILHWQEIWNRRKSRAGIACAASWILLAWSWSASLPRILSFQPPSPADTSTSNVVPRPTPASLHISDSGRNRVATASSPIRLPSALPSIES